eukprot:13375224-Heterocapsa_arctica.AAC.1
MSKIFLCPSPDLFGRAPWLPLSSPLSSGRGCIPIGVGCCAKWARFQPRLDLAGASSPYDNLASRGDQSGPYSGYSGPR